MLRATFRLATFTPTFARTSTTLLNVLHEVVFVDAAKIKTREPHHVGAVILARHQYGF